MKKILIAVVILAAIVAAGAYIFLTNIDDIARKAIEKAGTQVLGTPVSVGAVAISLSAGKAVIRDLKVANPSGFSSHPAIYFRELSAEIDARSRVIQRVYAGEPVFRVEMRGGSSNFDELARHIGQRFSGPDSDAASDRSAGAPAAGAGKREKSSAPVFQIRLFEIKDARLIISDDRGHHDELTLSRLVLKNLHGTSREIATQIVSQIMARIAVFQARRAIEKQIRSTVENHGGRGVRELLEGLGAK